MHPLSAKDRLIGRPARDVDHAAFPGTVPPMPRLPWRDVRMEHITDYLTDPETWNRITQAFARATATRLVDRMLNHMERRPPHNYTAPV